MAEFAFAADLAHALAYDPFGRLASHTAQGMTTTYTVNALDQRMGKRNASHQSRYVYAGFNQLLAEYTDGAWTSYVYRGGEPVALVRNDQLYFLHPDHLGRPQLATNASQQVVWKEANSAFGRGVTLDTLGGLNLGFPGQYYDTESGLWHNGYREYDAGLGRYLQSDPIGLAGGVNTYAYTFGNPVNLIDPLGLETGAAYRAIYLADGGIRQNTGRAPDFIQLSASLYVFGGSITLSRSGNIFTSGGIGRAYPNPVRGLGVSLNAGNLMSYCPNAKEQGAKTDKFLTGLGYSATAHDVIGGGVAYSPGSGGAVLYGLGAGVEVSPGSVGTQTPWSLPGW